MHRSVGGQSEIDIGDLIRAVVSRWRLLCLAMVATLGCAGLYLVVTPKRYASVMSFLVDPRERPPIGSDAAPLPQSSDSTIVEDQVRLLQSNTVLERVVKIENLTEDPDYAAKPSLLRSWLGGNADSAAGDNLQSAIANALAVMISVKHPDKSNVLDVEVRAASPAKSQKLAEALARAFSETHTNFDDTISDKQTKWLDDRIIELQTQLAGAQTRVQDYRSSNNIVVTDGMSPSERQMKDADTALVAARGRRAEAEAKYNQLMEAARTGSFETVRSPLMEKLRGEYAVLTRDFAQAQSTLGPRHPTVTTLQSQLTAQRQQIDREMNNTKEAQRREFIAAREVEKAAEDNIDKLKKNINEGRNKTLELSNLEGREASIRDSLQRLLAARQNARKAVISSPNPVLINQPALGILISPKAMPAIFIAIAAAINIWIIAALVMEYLARKGPRVMSKKPVPVAAEAPRNDDSEDDVGDDADDEIAVVVAPKAKATRPVATRPVARRTRSMARFEPEDDRMALDPEEEQGSAGQHLAEGFSEPAADDREQAHEQIALASFRRDKALFQSNHDAPDAAIVEQAIFTMERGDPAYRASIEALYDALQLNELGQAEAPYVAATSAKSGSGVTTMVLSLAILAVEQGARALIVDGNANHASLNALIPHLRPLNCRGIDMFLCHEDRQSGGRLLVARFEQARLLLKRQDLSDEFDLVLFDFGALHQRVRRMGTRIFAQIDLVQARSRARSVEIILNSEFERKSENTTQQRSFVA